MGFFIHKTSRLNPKLDLKLGLKIRFKNHDLKIKFYILVFLGMAFS